STNDRGEYRIFDLMPGRYYLGTARHSQDSFAAVYYPKTQEVTQAVPVEVPAGGELRGLDLTLAEMRSVKVHGAIRGPVGVPLTGIKVVAVPCDSGPLHRVAAEVRSSSGDFELRDVAPGCYLLAADTFQGGKRFSARLPITTGSAD